MKGVWYGFVRTPKGHFTEFSVSGAGNGNGQGTFSWAINQAGAVTGWWMDASNLTHGFVRAPDGGITKFDAPGAGTGWRGNDGRRHQFLGCNCRKLH